MLKWSPVGNAELEVKAHPEGPALLKSTCKYLLACIAPGLAHVLTKTEFVCKRRYMHKNGSEGVGARLTSYELTYLDSLSNPLLLMQLVKFKRS